MPKEEKLRTPLLKGYCSSARFSKNRAVFIIFVKNIHACTQGSFFCGILPRVEAILLIIVLCVTPNLALARKGTVNFYGQIDKYSMMDLVRSIVREISRIKPEQPRVIIINLNSGGGNIQEANHFYFTARTLEFKHKVVIKTQVNQWSSCESACTILFTAGAERIAHRRSSFGFHTPKVESRLPRNMTEEEVLTWARRLWMNAISRVDPEAALLIESRGYLFDSDMQYVEAHELDNGYVSKLK
jgi:hypothetical protein